jgi:hypothetical protein
VFARIFARIVILALLGGVVGLAVGLIGKYALDMQYFENPFWAVAAGIVVGAVIAVFVSMRLESKGGTPSRG